MSFFEHVPLAPSDPIFGLTAAYQSDLRPTKVNLGVGLYKTEDLRTPVLSSVKAAEQALLEQEESKEYLPIEGEKRYLAEMGALVFGKGKWEKEKDRIASFQTVGGTSGLKIGGTFLKEEAESSLWIPNPTWPNHRAVFSSCQLVVESYPYYDFKTHRLDFSQMMHQFERLPPKSIVLLHAACHNPTGADLNLEEWKLLCDLFKEKKLLAFFDFAYQGFGRGLDEDAEALRYFLKSGNEMLIAVSNSKNFSVYGERVGCLFVIAASVKVAEHIHSRVKQIIRTTYSNPPLHGASIVAQILSSSSLRQKWERELNEMRERINKTRLRLHQGLAAKGKAEAFHQLTRGRGMFGYTGLSSAQVERMRTEYGIYMTSDGRINVCGLNEDNMSYVVDALTAVS